MLKRFSLLFLLLAGTAQAAEPSSLFVVVDVAPPASELPRWAPVFSWIAPGAPAPRPEAVGKLLGTLAAVPQVGGVDPQRPFHVVLVNPQMSQKPIVLVVPVKNKAELLASLKDSPMVAHVTGKQAVIGTDATLQTMEKAVLAATHTAPPHGVHLVANLPAIDAAFGPLLSAVGHAQAPQGAGPAFGKMIDMVLDLMHQSERLTVDLDAQWGVPRVTLAVQARASTTMATAFAAQKPSDFAMVSKLPSPSIDRAMIMVGTMDTRTVGPQMAELLAGVTDKPEETRAVFNKFNAFLTGGFAGASQPGPTDNPVARSMFLLEVTDAAKALEILPAWNQALGKLNFLGGMVKGETRILPGTRYAGLPVVQSETTTQVTAPAPGKSMTMVQRNTWTGWGTLLASATGKDPLPDLRALVDAARSDKPASEPDADTRAALDRARAAHDSVWMRMNLSDLPPGTPLTAQGSPLPHARLDMGIGFSADTMRLRIVVDQKQ
jgi:hypothetical protein